jgi:hypothetical protein
MPRLAPLRNGTFLYDEPQTGFSTCPDAVGIGGGNPFWTPPSLNPEFAVETYCGVKPLAAKLVSRFCSST